MRRLVLFCTAVCAALAFGAGDDLVITDKDQQLGGVKSFRSGIKTDTISEYTGSAGITIGGVLLKSNILRAGSSGTAGYLVSFPATAEKGSLKIAAANSAGDTITTITNASQAAARIYTIPDAGADASFVQTEGAQTINGAKTFGSAIAGNLTGNAATATTANSIASASVFLSAEITADGNPQNTAHGLGSVPAVVIAIPSNAADGAAFVVAYGAHDATNCIVTCTATQKYRILAIK